MVEPLTTGKGLVVPNTGDLPGIWGSSAVNPNMSALDGMLAGFVTVSLTNLNVTLTAPAGFTATPGAGPVQSQNALIVFSGTLTGNVTVTFPLPGFYIVRNICTGAFYVKLAASSPGNTICAPPGEVCHVFCDGTNMFYVDLGPVGTYLDIAASAVPSWITNCTVPPFLNCDGSAFSAVTYPALAALLGGTTLPDSKGRARFALNQGSGRITSDSGNGIDGNTFLASGGSETLVTANLPAYTPAGTVTTTTTSNYGVGSADGQTLGSNAGSSFPVPWGSSQGRGTTFTSASIFTGTAQGGAAKPTLPPGYVGGLTLIRAA